jgi:hypothetical protein
LRENLAAIFITPSSWGSQRAGHSTRHQLFSGAIIPAIKLFSGAVDKDLKNNKPTSTTRQQLIFWRRSRGRVEDFCEGSFRTHILYFVIVLLYFILPASFFIKNLKKLESLVVVISLLLVHHVVP